VGASVSAFDDMTYRELVEGETALLLELATARRQRYAQECGARDLSAPAAPQTPKA